MTYEQGVSMGVGALSFVGSAAIQAAQTTGVSPVVVPVISAIIGAAISYGMLRGAVKALQKNHDDLRGELKEISRVTHQTSQQVARIEGTMERRGRPRDA